MDRLSQRFPPGLKYLVNYDTTTFVRATIHDVLITLSIAFVLVVIVVFVFLGSLRATLIPAIAVPVSVIGSFRGAVGDGLFGQYGLAARNGAGDRHPGRRRDRRGRERRTRNGGRTRACPPREATKKAMAEITAPIIAITLVLLSVFVPVAFIPGISGTLFRQFAVTISVAMLISALNALTLSPALCAVFLRHRGPRRGPMGWVLRRIDNIRDGYAAIVRRLVRVSVLGVVVILASAAGDLSSVLAHADRVSAGGGPGRLLYLGAIAGRRLGQPHRRGGPAASRPAEADAAGPERVRDRRLFDHRQRQRAEYGLHRPDS